MNENWKPMNVKDIPAIEEKLRAAIRTNTFADFASQYEGPAFGIDFDEKTGKVIYLSAEDIDSLVTLQCDVSK